MNIADTIAPGPMTRMYTREISGQVLSLLCIYNLSDENMTLHSRFNLLVLRRKGIRELEDEDYCTLKPTAVSSVACVASRGLTNASCMLHATRPRHNSVLTTWINQINVVAKDFSFGALIQLWAITGVWPPYGPVVADSSTSVARDQQKRRPFLNK